jgi:hypothetical protein
MLLSSLGKGKKPQGKTPHLRDRRNAHINNIYETIEFTSRFLQHNYSEHSSMQVQVWSI